MSDETKDSPGLEWRGHAEDLYARTKFRVPNCNDYFWRIRRVGPPAATFPGWSAAETSSDLLAIGEPLPPFPFLSLGRAILWCEAREAELMKTKV